MPRPFTDRGVYTLCAAATLAATLAACSSDTPVSPDEGDRPPTSMVASDSLATPAAGFPSKLAGRFAYVWADQPSSPNYTPSASYSFNGMGGSIQIIHGGTGTYIVSFGSLAGWGSGKLGFAATTYGSSTAECQMRNNMTAGTSLSVYVFCHDRVTQALQDSRFTLLVVGAGSVLPRSAFAWADGPLSPSYTPAPFSSHTTGPGPILVTHGMTDGDYDVSLGTGKTTRSTVLVHGNHGFQNFCKLGQWRSTSVRVRCFDGSAAPKNHYYWILQVQGGRTGKRIGFAFADKSTTASYTPSAGYSSNSSGGAITASRSGTGRYSIVFVGLQKLPGHAETVQVMAVGNNATTCKVLGWGNSANGLRVSVECRAPNGHLIDSRYNVLVIE